MDPIDLNRLRGDGLPEPHDYSCVSGDVAVIFGGHQQRLLQIIEEARQDGLVCTGAVAWLTDPEILGALATIPSSLVVQKEDFLRPDLEGGDTLEGWRDRLRDLYAAIYQSGELHALFQRQNFPPPLGNMSLLGDPGIAGVRCFGPRNDRKNSKERNSLMHNKFLVFSDLCLLTEPGDGGKREPREHVLWDARIVWTGSANLSRLAPRSRENCLVIRKPLIAFAYLHEWAQIMALSDPLDWDSDRVDPQWHEGT